MKASELRVGNKTSNGIVVNIFEDHFFTKVGDTAYNSKYHPAEPIPLTVGWLLKFGFVENFIGNKFSESWYELKYLSNEHEPMITSWVSILINIETWSCVICDEYPDEVGANTKIKIEYVHQLQNLYFALTGEELTLKYEL